MGSPTPLLDDDLQKSICDAASQLYWAEGWLALYRALEAALTLSILNYSLPEKWVDAGCGEGRFAEILARSAVTYHPAIGIDSDDERMRRCRLDHLFAERHVTSLDSLPLVDGSVDAVLCNSVLEHCEEPHYILKEFNRILIPNGELVLTIPTDSFEDLLAGTSILNWVGLKKLAKAYARWMSWRIEHRHYWNKRNTIELLESSGFDFVSSIGFASRRFSMVGDILHLLRMVGIGGSRFSRLTPDELKTRPLLRAIRRAALAFERQEIRREFQCLPSVGDRAVGMIVVSAKKKYAS